MSKDATATAAVAVKKKRKRTEDKWANFVSIPSLPKPDPISDNEMTEDDEAMNTEGVARIQVSKIRRELGERRTRNGEREKRRIAAAVSFQVLRPNALNLASPDTVFPSK